MRALIIHISDIHLCDSQNPSEPKFDCIATALQNEEVSLTTVTVVVSGDIAYSGSSMEYEIAKRNFTRLSNDLRTRLKVEEIKFVLIPGNHDCDFSKTDSVREIVIDGIRTGKDVDVNMIGYCCVPQQNFFTFRDAFPSASPDKQHNQIRWDYTVKHGGFNIQIRCFNTAWMSMMKERQGGVHMPDMAFVSDDLYENHDYTISVFHHPYNWMPSATYRTFRGHIEETSDLVLTGHEHEPDHYQKYSFTGEVNEYLEGAVFQEHGRDDRSGFHAIYLDLKNCTQRIVSFWWEDNLFQPTGHSDDWLPYTRGARGGKRDFDLETDFLNWLEDPGASYQHPAKPDLKLSDIYVLPNLKQFEIKNNAEFVYNSLVEGRDLLKVIGSKQKVILFGRQQAGKTTLAKVLFSDFYNKNLTPVFVCGDDINKTHLKLGRFEDLVETRFTAQYKNPLLPSFQQLDRERTVIIIDDFDHSQLNAKGRLRFLEEILQRYERIVILGDDVLKMEELASGSDGSSALSEFEQYEIIQFGYLLKSKLIRQWYEIGSEYETDYTELSKRILEAERLVTTMLGKNYLPHYPVFILSLVQANDSTTRPNSTAGTYGSLYEILITQALAARSSGVNLDTKLTYLSEIAYWMHEQQRKRISDEEWEFIHQTYCLKYKIRPSREGLKKEFAASGLFELRDQQYGFRHPASYYYFVARYMRDNLAQENMRAIVRGLLEKLYKEEHASIWLFMTHLSKDPFLIESVLDHAKKIYANLIPASFEEDIDFLSKFQEGVRKVVLKDRNFDEAKDERLRNLDSADESFEGEDIDVSEEETNVALKMLAEMNLALRTLEVLGQLVKNFPGSLQGTDKFQLVSECYALGLRTVTMMFDLFQQDIEGFIDLIVERVIEKHPDIKNKEDLKKRVGQFMFWMIESTTFGMVKRISLAVGHSQLGETYKEVKNASGTNASCLIDVSIRLDNLGFPGEELEQLMRKFKSSFFCERVLKQLVVEHFYLFPTREATKQRVCTALGIEIQSIRNVDATSTHERKVPLTALPSGKRR